eukprot:15442197-Alexandrium_andersonii.AAC.1
MRIGVSRIGVRDFARSWPRIPSILELVGAFGICARDGAECTLGGLGYQTLRSLLALRSSSSELRAFEG